MQPSAQADKLQSYLETWHIGEPQTLYLAAAPAIPAVARAALREPPARRKDRATRLAERAETAARARFSALDPRPPAPG